MMEMMMNYHQLTTALLTRGHGENIKISSEVIWEVPPLVWPLMAGRSIFVVAAQALLNCVKAYARTYNREGQTW